VIRPGFKAENRISLTVLCRKHDHGALEAVRTNLLAGLTPVLVRQIDVEQHQIDVLVPNSFSCAAGVFAFADIKLFVKGKLLRQGLAKRFIVIDNKNSSRAGHILPFRKSRLIALLTKALARPSSRNPNPARKSTYRLFRRGPDLVRMG